MARFLDLDLITARLQDQLEDGLVRYLARIDLPEQGRLARSQPGPGLLIVPLRTAVVGEEGARASSWRAETFGLITDVRDVSAVPTRARDTLLAIREAFDTALSGWSPATGWTPISYAGGRMLAVDDGIYRHIDEYTTEHGVSLCV